MIELKLFRKFKKQPYSLYKTINKITVIQLKQMYSIYEKYYENTSYELFESDFLQKTGIFLIFDPQNNIVGFSTVVERDFLIDGQAQYAFFSGDTIIEKKYWGSHALQRSMARYILTYKMKHPTRPVYWMLISKGFKTYLLLANNYYTYYPNVENKHSHLKHLIEAYCVQYFDEYYNPQTGLLNFGEDYQALKASVAPIQHEMRIKNKNIDFFESVNPTWIQGTELPCIGEISWKDLYRRLRSSKKKPTVQATIEQHPSILRKATEFIADKVA
ncbi:hypothetical protein EC844_13233 [Acinetobacter calcoaceticus]|uniref:Uncharacterized protein n=1 Tax=Acinetobacter calcoaceticus TaxID=471 RepID=A0A4R1XC32_ACICA|nr:hypothetical protein EC844_13233 [Acinetobacter calcoaceticus]